jgi:rfaE bifunctional protein kinase chain/domain
MRRFNTKRFNGKFTPLDNNIDKLVAFTPSLDKNWRDNQRIKSKPYQVETLDAVRQFQDEGWKIKGSYQNREKSNRISSHFIKMEHPDLVIRNDKGQREALANVLISNSCSGTKPMTLDVGAFRMVCSNGLYSMGSISHAAIKHNEKNQHHLPEIIGNFNLKTSGVLEEFKKLKVLVIGEMIIDKYCFGDVIGKSGKEPHLVLKENFIEYYLGGSGAIARHLSTFVKDVTIISPFGKEKFYETIIKKDFDKNIISFFFKPYFDFKTITKTRFVDKNSNYKLFGSYLLPDKNNSQTENKIIKLIKQNKRKTNMTLICDYGHNFISKKIATEIIKKNKYTFLNAQINASNKGFHNINKYNSINSIVINENELRQELRDNSSHINILAKTLIKNKKIQNLIVTRGINGAILINNKYQVFSCPGFALKSIDKVGAGDAMLSLASLGLKLKLDPELVLFISSLAAAISVETIGNKEQVTYHKLDRILEYMLK